MESKYFLKGTVRILSRDNSAIRLEFILEAPWLTLTELNINGVEDREAADLRNWLGNDAQTLTAGRPYTKSSDGLAQQRIEQFFAALGRRVAISSNLELDYRDRTARLSYRIFEGPRGPVQYDLAPPGQACKEQVGELNLTDVDDYVPLVLVERMTKLHAFSCFDEKLVLEDTRRLEETNLFQSVKYSVGGDPSFRRVTLSIRGKPLKIDGISMQGYGTSSNLGPAAKDSQLPIGVGDVYKRSEIVKAAEKLTKSASRPQEKVDVFVDVEPVSPNSVAVKFQILTYDSDKLYIDGKRVDSESMAVSRLI